MYLCASFLSDHPFILIYFSFWVHLADRRSFLGRTPLGAASRGGWLEVVEYLLTTHHPNINHQDDEKSTALILAAYFNQPLTVQYLLQEGADFTIKGFNGKTALELSVQKNNKEVTRILKNFIEK